MGINSLRQAFLRKLLRKNALISQSPLSGCIFKKTDPMIYLVDTSRSSWKHQNIHIQYEGK